MPEITNMTKMKIFEVISWKFMEGVANILKNIRH
jgi:hypothetical protein